MRTVPLRVYPRDKEYVQSEVVRLRKEQKYQPRMPVSADVISRLIKYKLGEKKDEKPEEKEKQK